MRSECALKYIRYLQTSYTVGITSYHADCVLKIVLKVLNNMLRAFGRPAKHLVTFLEPFNPNYTSRTRGQTARSKRTHAKLDKTKPGRVAQWVKTVPYRSFHKWTVMQW